MKNEMTIERLETYRGLLAERNAIVQQIDELSKPLQTINRSSGVQKQSSGISNPTERSALKIIELEEKVLKIDDELNAIESWIDDIVDGELRAILRWHYINGYNWNRTNIKVLGYSSYDTSRKKVERYFNDK